MEDGSVKEDLKINEDVQNTNLEVLNKEIIKSEVEIKDVPQLITHNPQLNNDNPVKVSALSLASIRAKKELLESQKGVVKEEVKFPTEAFTETEMLDFWFKYAQRLTDKGLMIMASLLRISDPKLNGFAITYELPNEGSKIDFEKEKNELLGYLRGHLHNHDITIDVVVNEKVKSKVAFTAQDKYNRLKEINPNLELLKKMFDLEI
ncbi:DNA polymerase III subunit gamma/tau [Flavobacterium sp.]|uniref:DNA polymerase III subunit gamma/tau n=1 Tax=Flavobacterium sp. TaxID=239 RepID=UPI0037528113